MSSSRASAGVLQPKVILVARIWVVIYAAVIAAALWMGSILPLMVVGLHTYRVKVEGCRVLIDLS